MRRMGRIPRDGITRGGVSFAQIDLRGGAIGRAGAACEKTRGRAGANLFHDFGEIGSG